MRAFDDAQARDFQNGSRAASVLIHERATFMDQLLTACWHHFVPAPWATRLALCAVGGYGRQELHPHSDVDILILLPEGDQPPPGVEALLRLLWDVGVKPGHSVRTVQQCVEQAQRDQTVMTNQLDARRLDGSAELFARFEASLGPHHLWPGPAFFAAKLKEQRARYAKYHDTAFIVEPNIKEGPGGLRDLQMIGWVLKRQFGAKSLQDLLALGFLTDTEFAELTHAQNFLWAIRFALHGIAGRSEERLLFGYQKALAAQFGYEDTQRPNHAVEQFMQGYYRMVKGMEQLNEMLMQLFNEVIVNSEQQHETAVIDARFQAVNEYLEVRHSEIFAQDPVALLEVFRALQRNRQLKGVRATTMRLIRQSLHLINGDFRRNPAATQCFMQILRAPAGVSSELRRMHRLGVLGAYLPEFTRVAGMMQFDLFHVYTVDEHTLFVVRNLRRLANVRQGDEPALCHAVFRRIDKPELLYIAGLFHDIAKGSGEDHCIHGQSIVEAFAERHRLSAADTHLVSWLVRNHLLMSLTAQRKDVEDPDVINEFTRQVGSEQRLDCLYLLTVADIRATNPNLWNAWREALLRTLYLAALRAFQHGLNNPLEAQDKLVQTQADALALLSSQGIDAKRAKVIWAAFPEDYFVRYAAEEIAWHTAAIANATSTALPLVLLRPPDPRGSTEVFIYARHADHHFAACTAVLDQLGLNIVDAKVIRLSDGHVLHSYFVLEHSGKPIRHGQREQEITHRIRTLLGSNEPPPVVGRRHPPQIRHFPVQTEIHFHTDPLARYSILELQAADRPGLLSKVGQAFSAMGIRLHNAKVATLGSRAEDVFFITDQHNQPIESAAQQTALSRALIALLRDDQSVS